MVSSYGFDVHLHQGKGEGEEEDSNRDIVITHLNGGR
jgi:hypothetical protein